LHTFREKTISCFCLLVTSHRVRDSMHSIGEEMATRNDDYE